MDGAQPAGFSRGGNVYGQRVRAGEGRGGYGVISDQSFVREARTRNLHARG